MWNEFTSLWLIPALVGLVVTLVGGRYQSHFNKAIDEGLAGIRQRRVRSAVMRYINVSLSRIDRFHNQHELTLRNTNLKVSGLFTVLLSLTAFDFFLRKFIDRSSPTPVEAVQGISMMVFIVIYAMYFLLTARNLVNYTRDMSNYSKYRKGFLEQYADKLDSFSEPIRRFINIDFAADQYADLRERFGASVEQPDSDQPDTRRAGEE